ncbi:MAG: DinB family protein [Dissulfurispiraceae bacterium]|jgi:hypothetical protein
MPTAEAARLVKLIQKKIGKFKDACKGIDEDMASSAPEGSWTPKQIVSHVCGPEGEGYMASIRAFLEQDTPRLDIEAWDPFYTEKRSRMTMAQLLAELDGEYGRISDLTARLTDDQLARKAHVPLLKNTPMGEYPTLAIWIQAIVKDHIDFHIAHMQEIMLGRRPRNACFW